MSRIPIYPLITPARNEAQSIELTIKSVLAQTVRPLKWAIVSDGSADETDVIVSKYAAEHHTLFVQFGHKFRSSICRESPDTSLLPRPKTKLASFS
jgi:glycosyltransferase involved in cell wall biosynthesis